MFWMVIRPSALRCLRASRRMSERSSSRKILPERAGLPPLAAEKQVVGDRQRRRQSEVLVDGLDAGVARLDRRAEMHRLAVHQHLAGIGDDRAGEHLDQRRLAGAVVADDAEDLVRPEVEIGMVERHDAAVVLDQAARLQNRLRMSVALMPTPS